MPFGRAPDDGSPKQPFRMLAADAVTVAVSGVVAFATGSLTLMAETIRGGAILVQALAGLLTESTAPAGPAGSYEFGMGKIQESKNLVIGLATLFAGFWMADRVIDRIARGTDHPVSWELPFAAATLALFTARAGISAVRLLRARAEPLTPEKRGELRGAVIRFASLIVVQAAVTVGALASDHLVSLITDAAGAALIALLVTAAGARLSVNAVSALIDHPLDRHGRRYVERRLRDAGIDRRELVDLRARRSGHGIFVELTVDPELYGSLEEARRRLGRIQRALTAERGDLDVTIRLRTADGRAGALPA